MANATDIMQQEYAAQYDCPSVLLTGHVDADLVITFAYAGRDEPEVYTEEAIRDTIAHEASRQ